MTVDEDTTQVKETNTEKLGVNNLIVFRINLLVIQNSVNILFADASIMQRSECILLRTARC